MESKKTLREIIYRNVWAFAAEKEYDEKLTKFMEDNGIKFKTAYILNLPGAGWFAVYEIWSAGDIGPSRYAIESKLKTLREETKKRKLEAED